MEPSDPDRFDELPPAQPDEELKRESSAIERRSIIPSSLRCRMGFHAAMPSRVWNDGHYFSACSRCGVSLIRTPQEDWHPVPGHFKIVWRKRTDDDISWPQHTL